MLYIGIDYTVIILSSRSSAAAVRKPAIKGGGIKMYGDKRRAGEVTAATVATISLLPVRYPLVGRERGGGDQDVRG